MSALAAGMPAIVVGGTRGLGAGLTSALLSEGVAVTVIARDAGRRAMVPPGAVLLRGDARDGDFAASTLRSIKPQLVVVVAGAPPPMAPIDEMTWSDFSLPWEVDVRIAHSWIQAALRHPQSADRQFVMVSSGAAVGGSPLSGGYAGAKRMQWLMANYADALAQERGLSIRFTTVAPMQMAPGTGIGEAGATAYAAKLGMGIEAFFERFGAPLTAELFGSLVLQAVYRSKKPSRKAFGLRSSGLEEL